MNSNSLEVLKMVQKVAGENLRNYGYVTPVLLLVDGDRLYPMAISMKDAEEKELLASFIQSLRERAPLFFFVCEAWMGVYKSMTDEKQQQIMRDGIENEPDRKEVVQIIMYEGVHTKVCFAEMIRSGDSVSLGEWNDEQLTGMSGRFMRPPEFFN